MLSDDMILYTENPKEFKDKELELINEFNKVAGYKINTQTSIVFCIYVIIQKRNIKSNSIYISTKKNKIPRSKFNQEGERLAHWKLQNFKKKEKENLKRTN